MHEDTSLAEATPVRWADKLQALARTGLFYATNDYDRERYQQVLEIAAEMASLVTGLTSLQIQTAWANDVGHVTPRVGVGAAIFDERGAILLLQRPESGLWSLPVGFADVGESPARGITREVREETGLLIRPQRLLGVYDCRGPSVLHHLYNIIFWCSVEGGTLTPSAEAPAARYFPRDSVPPVMPHHTRSIADAFTAHHDGWQGTAFDP